MGLPRSSCLASLLMASLAGCASAPEIARMGGPPQRQHTVPAPTSPSGRPMFAFATFGEGLPWDLFALDEAPLLRVGSELYSLRGHAARREPALEKLLFAGATRPWWGTLAGSASGTLFADRRAPGATPSDPDVVDVVRLAPEGPVSIGPVVTPYPTVRRLVPLPDGRVLVELTTPEGGVDGDEIARTEIVPAVVDDGFAADAYYGRACRRNDGSVAVVGRSGYDAPTTLVTWRPGAKRPSSSIVTGLPPGRIHLFEADDGVLRATVERVDTHFVLSGTTFSPARIEAPPTPERSPGDATDRDGAHLRARAIAIARAHPFRGDFLRFDLRGRHLEVRATGFARDAEGGEWVAAPDGLGLFHDTPPSRIEALGPAPASAPPAPLSWPPQAPALPSDPGASLASVLDASRLLGDSGTLAIRPLDGRTFVLVDDQILYVDGDTLKSDPSLQRGLGDRGRYSEHVAEAIGAAGGHFPESTWLQISYKGDRTQFAGLFRWRGTGWQEVPEAGSFGFADQILPLAGGWSLLDEVFSYGMPGTEHHLVLLHPDASRTVSGAGLVGLEQVALGQASVIAVTTLADGTILAGLTDHERRAEVRAWGADGAPTPLAPWPRSIVPLHIAARSLRDVTVVAAPFDTDPSGKSSRVVHYDGTAWTDEALPGADASTIDHLHLGPAGATWATHEDSEVVSARAANGVWSTFRAPGHLDAVWVGPAGDVWAVSGSKLLHTRPLPAGFDLAKVLPPRQLEPDRGACASVSLILHEVPKTAPADARFDETLRLVSPALGELASSAAYYEVRSAGRRYLVLHLESPSSRTDAETAANAVKELVARKLPRAEPRLVCLGDLTTHTLPRGAESIRAVGGTADRRAVFK